MPQVLCRADAGEHQELWGTEGACGEQYFGIASERMPLPSVCVLDGHGPLLLEYDPIDLRARNDAQSRI